MASRNESDDHRHNRKQFVKRKRPFGESLRTAYESVSFAPLVSSGHPRSPHRFFKESYATVIEEKNVDPTQDQKNSSQLELTQVVHHHVNGLCIVTAGSRLPEKSIIDGIEFVAKEAPTCNAAEKRKRQAKMLKGSKVDDTVSPTTVIAKLNLASGKTVPIFACVWGTILELNHSLTTDVLVDDPLLDGYLAVILPSGKFPPSSVNKPFAEKKDLESPRQKVAKVSTEESATGS